jgi:serine/threonine protein kinase
MNEPYNFRADFWSLGVITFYLLSGHFPFSYSNDNKETLFHILHTEPKYYSKKWSNISYEAADFVKKLLKKNPEERISIIKILIHSWINEY